MNNCVFNRLESRVHNAISTAIGSKPATNRKRDKDVQATVISKETSMQTEPQNVPVNEVCTQTEPQFLPVTQIGTETEAQVNIYICERSRILNV